MFSKNKIMIIIPPPDKQVKTFFEFSENKIQADSAAWVHIVRVENIHKFVFMLCIEKTEKICYY